MSYRIFGLDPAPFTPLYGLSDEELVARGARRVRVGPEGGVPDRVELRDLREGEVALLVNHVHQPEHTPYHARYAVYVREGSTTPRNMDNEVPDVMRRRLLALRAFDAEHLLIEADVLEGTEADARLRAMFAKPDVAYVHVHYARPGCFAARVERLAA
ncbi:DUF1203 domain-containing protein [Lysobacter sp. TY2-98]|uniref:DUF1203 domain-containing protein n=1 Tax=Lysobacter sp. TY2-98 TaxID=2290922 RepID=UPI000E2054C9|nr:DUF1203 domain-containing protein [Lysobacter sp. TY2-98]AXK72086.1 DUF1203 domain-containing protein [Lysobacter sp. TY2-98]